MEGAPEDGLHGGLSARGSDAVGEAGDGGEGQGEGHPVEELDRQEPPGIRDAGVEAQAQAEAEEGQREGAGVAQFLDDFAWGVGRILTYLLSNLMNLSNLINVI